MDKGRGVIFCAGGQEKYIREARAAASSVKAQMPKLPIALFTDKPVKKGKEFDLLFETQEFDHPQKLKMHGMLRSPFDKTLYLDSDTKTEASLWELFGLLEFYDIGLTHRVKCEWPPYAPAVFIDYIDTECLQGGFVLFRKSGSAMSFIRQWHNRFVQVPKDAVRSGLPLGDQPILNEIYQNEKGNPDLAVVFLPNFIYNARPWMWQQLKKDGMLNDVKIFHAHGLDESKVKKLYRKIRHKIGWG